MSWEYRVVRTPQDVVGSPFIYSINEVFSNPNSTVLAECYGETRAELLSDFRAMARALTLPVLEWRDGRFVEVEPPIIKSEIDKGDVISEKV